LPGLARRLPGRLFRPVHRGLSLALGLPDRVLSLLLRLPDRILDLTLCLTGCTLDLTLGLAARLLSRPRCIFHGATSLIRGVLRLIGDLSSSTSGLFHAVSCLVCGVLDLICHLTDGARNLPGSLAHGVGSLSRRLPGPAAYLSGGILNRRRHGRRRTAQLSRAAVRLSRFARRLARGLADKLL
jgi:hypothetical protein